MRNARLLRGRFLFVLHSVSMRTAIAIILFIVVGIVARAYAEHALDKLIERDER